jgi:hypothetical protein
MLPTTKQKANVGNIHQTGQTRDNRHPAFKPNTPASIRNTLGMAHPVVRTASPPVPIHINRILKTRAALSTAHPALWFAEVTGWCAKQTQTMPVMLASRPVTRPGKPESAHTSTRSETTLSGGGMSTIEKKLTEALTKTLSSEQLGTLLEEAETALSQAEADAKAARALALDATRSPDPAKAKATMEAAEFARDRLRGLIPKLDHRYQQVADAEEYNS